MNREKRLRRHPLARRHGAQANGADPAAEALKAISEPGGEHSQCDVALATRPTLSRAFFPSPREAGRGCRTRMARRERGSEARPCPLPAASRRPSPASGRGERSAPPPCPLPLFCLYSYPCPPSIDLPRSAPPSAPTRLRTRASIRRSPPRPHGSRRPHTDGKVATGAGADRGHHADLRRDRRAHRRRARQHLPLDARRRMEAAAVRAARDRHRAARAREREAQAAHAGRAAAARSPSATSASWRKARASIADKLAQALELLKIAKVAAMGRQAAPDAGRRVRRADAADLRTVHGGRGPLPRARARRSTISSSIARRRRRTPNRARAAAAGATAARARSIIGG